jgi:hypothetical protein
MIASVGSEIDVTISAGITGVFDAGCDVEEGSGVSVEGIAVMVNVDVKDGGISVLVGIVVFVAIAVSLGEISVDIRAISVAVSGNISILLL